MDSLNGVLRIIFAPDRFTCRLEHESPDKGYRIINLSIHGALNSICVNQFIGYKLFTPRNCGLNSGQRQMVVGYFSDARSPATAGRRRLSPTLSAIFVLFSKPCQEIQGLSPSKKLFSLS